MRSQIISQSGTQELTHPELPRRARFRRFCPALIVLCFIAHTFSLVARAATPEVERRVESILNRMTLEEKIDMLGGVDGFFIRGFPRLGLPRLKMADGPIGVRNEGPATTMAGGIPLASSLGCYPGQHVGNQRG